MNPRAHDSVTVDVRPVLFAQRDPDEFRIPHARILGQLLDAETVPCFLLEDTR